MGEEVPLKDSTEFHCETRTSLEFLADPYAATASPTPRLTGALASPSPREFTPTT
jgi:hypothetical protein